MLCLLFHLGSERYAIEARQVLEVMPLVRIKEIPQAPKGVAGLINYRGSSIPVLDLSALATGQPAMARLSTRILIIDYRSASGSQQILGLLAERATETLHIKESDFQPSGVHLPGAPYLGPVAHDGRGIIQKVSVSELIPAEVQELLFRSAANA